MPSFNSFFCSVLLFLTLREQGETPSGTLLGTSGCNKAGFYLGRGFHSFLLFSQELSRNRVKPPLDVPRCASPPPAQNCLFLLRDGCSCPGGCQKCRKTHPGGASTGARMTVHDREVTVRLCTPRTYTRRVYPGLCTPLPPTLLGI